MSQDTVEFRVLGALEVRRGGAPVPLGPPKLRTVLAVLLCDAGRAVSLDTLVDSLWPDAPPKSAVKNVQGYVSRLRREVLGDPARIDLDASGYRLAARPGELDAARFAELVHEGRVCGDPERRAEHFRRALGLWHGKAAYAGVPRNRLCEAEALRLAEVRLGVLLEWADLRIGRGRAAGLVPELVALTREHPLNEELWARLMRALHACGRPADALRAFEDARRTLLAEGGLEPSPPLRSLRRQIASGAPGTPAPRTAARDTVAPGTAVPGSAAPGNAAPGNAVPGPGGPGNAALGIVAPGAAGPCWEGGWRCGGSRTTRLRGTDEAHVWGDAMLAPVRLSPLGARGFRGTVDDAAAGAVVVGRLRCSPHVLSRHARFMRSTDRELAKVVLNRSRTDMLVSQNGRERALAPGRLVVCDMTRPYDIVVRDRCDVAFLGVPHRLFGAEDDRLRAQAGLPLPADGTTKMIAQCLADMTDRPGDLAGRRGRHLGDALTAMLRAALTGTALERVETPADLADRILAYASAALHDPSLSEESVARAHGISTGRLRRLFREREVPLMEWVRRERLRHFRGDLRDPAFADRSVASVAARWGLADADRAGRALEAEFGQSPAEIRPPVRG